MTPETPRTILVPLDGTEHALAALPVAATLAQLETAMLHIVHVTERAPSPRELIADLHLDPRALERAVVERLAGAPEDAIIDAAVRMKARFITLCTHTADDKPWGQLGHVAEEVMRRAPCPVVLVQPGRGTAPFRLGSVLFPHDGTPTSAAALGPATELADRAGATLHVLHVATSAQPTTEEQGTLGAPRYLDQPQHEWPAWTREFLERLGSCSRLPKDVHLALAHGDPKEEVIRFATARHVDLILVAWRGRLEEQHAGIVKAALWRGPAPVMVMRVEG